MKILMRTLMPTILICFLAPAAVVFARITRRKQPARSLTRKRLFAELKTLSGSWQGTVMAKLINITIRITSSGNVILNEATAEGVERQIMRSLRSTWRGIVCSRPIIVTPEIVRTWKAS